MTSATWKRNLIVLVAALGVAVTGWTAVAQAHSGHPHNPTRIDEGQVVNSTLFVSGRELQMSGEIEGDYICAGQNVTISGRVQGDILCVAQNIRITGSVEGDVRLLAQTAVVSGQVGGSLSAATQSLQLERPAAVARDLSLAVTDARIAGSVGRDIQAVADAMTIDGLVGRNVNAQVDRLTLASGTNIKGTVTYTSDRELQRNANAQVGGAVNRQRPQDNSAGGPNQWLAAMWSLAMFSLLVTSLLLVLVLPKQFRALSNVAWRQPGYAVLAGFALSVAAPAVIVVLALTVIGLPLALLIGLLWLLLIVLSGPVAAYVLGRLVLRDRRPAWLMMLFGGILLILLYSVPVLNVIVASAVIWIGTGTIVLAVLERVRMKPQPKKPKKKE